MTIEPMLKLSFVLYSNPGVYAILLGSGVSGPAGILTGWDVTLDLVKKLAVMSRKDPGGDPSDWYKSEYGEEPDYSKILDDLSTTSWERRNILHGYFEPNEDERKRGLKAPTKAHLAIARLVKDGIIKVILTTNFDRLIEQALEAIGIHPQVISTPDHIKGAEPLTHASCTVVKLHGDYRDVRIRNTEKELASYDDEMNEYLDRILAEYGLIICGWSATWDIALGEALKRRASRRYGTFWTVRGGLSPAAKDLSGLLKADVITIEDADSFFDTLSEQIISLVEYDRPHPLSIKASLETLKRYLPDETNRIRVADMLREETELVIKRLAEKNLYRVPQGCSVDQVKSTLEQCEVIMERLCRMIALGAYWNDYEYFRDLVIETSARIRNDLIQINKTSSDLLSSSAYPLFLLSYCTGIGSLGGRKYSTVAGLLSSSSCLDEVDEKELLLHMLVERSKRLNHIVGRVPKYKGKSTAASNWLHGKLREWLKDVVPDLRQYDELFDRFEYLLCLLYYIAENRDNRKTYSGWVPVGRFAWRDTSIYETFGEELEALGDNHPYVQKGLFRSWGELQSVHQQVSTWIQRSPGWAGIHKSSLVLRPARKPLGA